MQVLAGREVEAGSRGNVEVAGQDAGCYAGDIERVALERERPVGSRSAEHGEDAQEEGRSHRPLSEPTSACAPTSSLSAD